MIFVFRNQVFSCSWTHSFCSCSRKTAWWTEDSFNCRLYHNVRQCRNFVHSIIFISKMQLKNLSQDRLPGILILAGTDPSILFPSDICFAKGKRKIWKWKWTILHLSTNSNLVSTMKSKIFSSVRNDNHIQLHRNVAASIQAQAHGKEQSPQFCSMKSSLVNGIKLLLALQMQSTRDLPLQKPFTLCTRGWFKHPILGQRRSQWSKTFFK